MAPKEIVRRHKTLARLLLYGVPVLLLALWLALPGEDELDPGIETDWADIDYSQVEEVQMLRDYLRIDTSYPDGSEIVGAEFLARHLESAGLDVHLERLGERNANLWAELPGEDPRALVLHNHIDINRVDRPEDWLADPYGGVINPPFIYGRGAFDMKGVAISQLMAVLDLARSGAKLERSVLFLATGDEERDSWLGTRRLLREHPEWREKFWAVLTEGGAVEATSLREARYWGTEFHQKRFVDVWVCGSDRERLEELREFLHHRQMERRVTPALAEFFPYYAPSRDRPATRTLLADPSRLLERIRTWPRNVNKTVIPPYVDHMMRSRLVAFPVEEAPGGGFRVRLILHLHSIETVDEVWDELIGDALEDVTYRVESTHGPVGGSPLDHEAFLRLDAFMARHFPDIDHGPISIPYSATDARYFREVGIPAYGYSPFHMLAVDAAKLKGANERIPLVPFMEGVETYTALVRDLVTSSGALSDDGREQVGAGE